MELLLAQRVQRGRLLIYGAIIQGDWLLLKEKSSITLKIVAMRGKQMCE